VKKVGTRGNKLLLRELLRPYLGVRLAHRPKRGFEIPVDRWFREPASEPLLASLRQGFLVSNLGFRPQAIASIIDQHLRGDDLGRKLFALTALEHWAQRFA